MWHMLVIAVALSMACSARAAYWHTDFGQAQVKAYGENRIMLVYFTSSDRGGLCQKMQDEVFSKYEFQTFADRHLVLMEVDFPRWKQLHPTQLKINRELADKYQAHGWPVIVLLNNRGEVIGRMGYREGGSAGYIKAIEQAAGLTERNRAATRDAEPPPMFSGAPTGPAPKYTSLTLKSISGTGAKRLALINNATLAAGESGKVRLGTGEVKIRCDEIREASVIVTVDGKVGKRELRLFSPAETAKVR
jgi:thioredoxin-related protein